jgi:hypothetical protein
MLSTSIEVVYVALFAACGVGILVAGWLGFGQGRLGRGIELVVGLAILAASVYLIFFYEENRVGFAAFVLCIPGVVMANVESARRKQRKAAAAGATGGPGA